MQLYRSHRAHHALGQAYKTLVLGQDGHISVDSSNIFKTPLQSLTRKVANNPAGPRTVRHPFFIFLEATSSRTHSSPSF